MAKTWKITDISGKIKGFGSGDTFDYYFGSFDTAVNYKISVMDTTTNGSGSTNYMTTGQCPQPEEPCSSPQFRTISSETCVGFDKYKLEEYQKSCDNGVTWATTSTSITTLLEVNSAYCGYVPPQCGCNDFSLSTTALTFAGTDTQSQAQYVYLTKTGTCAGNISELIIDFTGEFSGSVAGDYSYVLVWPKTQYTSGSREGTCIFKYKIDGAIDYCNKSIRLIQGGN